MKVIVVTPLDLQSGRELKPFFIVAENISSFGIGDDKRPWIQLQGEENYFFIKETPVELTSLIQKAQAI